MQYGLKPGSRIDGDAQRIGESLEQIRIQRGILTPAVVVDEARPTDHPLHDQFEWSNKEAAEKWRRQQAQHLIAAVVLITPETAANPPKAYFSVADVGPDGRVERRFEPLQAILSDENLRNQVLADIRASLASLQRKLTSLQNVESLLKALKSAERVAKKLMVL